jgi:hypothetical protein
MRDNKAIGTLAGLVALGCSVALVFSVSGGFGPRLDPLPHQAAGRVLAEQTLSLLKPGGLVTVITRDTSTFQNPATDVLLASLRNQLAKAGVKIASLQALEVDPLRPVAVPAGDFFQWIKNSAKGSVIVSLMGPPVLNETQSAQLGEVKPAIVAFCSGPVREQVDLRSLFSSGLLHAAVVSRRNVTSQNRSSLSEQQSFERQFIAVTPSNLAALATASNPVP